MGMNSGEDEGPDEQPGTAGTPNDDDDDDAATTDEPVLLEADGCPSGFEAERAGFVAGHADRLVRSNSYVPLGAPTGRCRPTTGCG